MHCITVVHARRCVLPVREVRQIEMPEHHTGTQEGSQGVGHAFACNVFADMPRTLLKDGHIGTNIGTCMPLDPLWAHDSPHDLMT